MTKFKQLSYWAREHKWPSRFIIIFSFIAMNILGAITGLLLAGLDIAFSVWFLASFILIFSLVWLSYPSKKQDRNLTYAFRKTCDVVLIGTTFCLFMYFGNRQVTPLSSSIFSVSAVASVPKDSTKTYKSLNEFGKSLKDKNGKPLKWKERKKLLKQQVKGIKKDQAMSDGGKVVLIILCVLLAVALACGVAALSCSLSCSGSEGAAVAVAVLGLAGIALLTFFAIHSIIRKSNKEKPKEDKPATNN